MEEIVVFLRHNPADALASLEVRDNAHTRKILGHGVAQR